jgi:outer membrane protein assembly factor BamB
MGRMRAAAVGMAMAVVAVGLSSPGVGASSNASLAGGDEWPMIGGSFTHAGASQAVGPSSPAASWELNPKRTEPRGYVDWGNSPVVGSKGTIYLVQSPATPPFTRTHVVAISPSTHKTLWTWSLSGVRGAGGALNETPAVATDGVVYVATNILYAIKDGRTLWQRKNVVGTFGPTIGPDGTVYAWNENKGLEALNPQNGDRYWSSADAYASSEPALSPDGTTLYVAGSVDLYALSAGRTGGQVEWTYPITATDVPAVGPDGTIYVSSGGTLDAINANGTLKWSYVSPDGTFAPSSPAAVTAAGQVVASLDVGYGGIVVVLQQSDGTLAWSYSAPPEPSFTYFSSPVSDADGNIYIQNASAVSEFSPQGSLMWTTDVYPYGGSPPPSPAIDSSGTLYVNGGDQSLIAYESNG